MSGGWSKHFTDGTLEVGTDEMVNAGKASWRRGKLSEMIFVLAWHKNFTMSIGGRVGDYWQSEDYVVRVLEESPIRAVRRIQRKLQDDEDYFSIKEREKDIRIRIGSFEAGSEIYRIKKQDKNKWLTLEFHIHTERFLYHLSEQKI